jgi:hypothetical protein
MPREVVEREVAIPAHLDFTKILLVDRQPLLIVDVRGRLASQMEDKTGQ